MPDILNLHDLDVEMEKLLSIFREGVTDYFTTHEVIVSIGASVFPKPARSAKKLVEQAIAALKEAQKTKGSSLEVFAFGSFYFSCYGENRGISCL